MKNEFWEIAETVFRGKEFIGRLSYWSSPTGDAGDGDGGDGGVYVR